MQPPLMPPNEPQRLEVLQDFAVLDTPPEEPFERITRLACRVLDVPTALVSLVDWDRQWFKSRQGLEACQTSREVSFCSHVVYDGRPLVVEDTLEDERFTDNPLVTGPPYIRFYAGAPLMVAGGLCMGSLCLLDYRPRRLDPEQLTTLTELAAVVVDALHYRNDLRALERARAQALHERSLLQSVLEASEDPIYAKDRQGRYLIANQASVRTLTITSGAMIGRTARELLDGESAARIEAADRQVLETGNSVRLTFSPVNDPVRRLSELNKSPLYDAEGQIDGVVTVARDITRLVQGEARERRHKQLLDILHRAVTDYLDLLQSHRVWDFLLESLLQLTQSQYGFIGAVVEETLADGTTRPAIRIQALTNIAWDPGASRLLEQLRSGDMLISNPDSLIGAVLGDGEVIISHDPRNDPRAGGLPPGHPPLDNYLGIPIYDQGRLVGACGLANRAEGYDDELVDYLKPFHATCAILIHLMEQIDERDRAARALMTARDEAERANRAKSDFLSSMSHELRTPLNAIIGFAQVLTSSQREPLSPRQQGQVEHIFKGGRHLLELINEVLDLARIESGRIALSLEDVDTNSLLEEVFQMILPLAEEAGIEPVNAAANRNLPTIRADYTRTKQVLLNLLSNAVKYNRPGGELTLDAQVLGSSLRVTVRDGGLGIPAAYREQIFQPFARLGRDKSAIEGTGIGLVIAKRLVEEMDGSIGFDSREGQGSEFWFDLNRVREAA